MSLKGVEMQLALPRASEATQAQHHLNHKPVNDQAAAAAQQVKQAERQLSMSSAVTSSEFLGVREDGQGGGSGKGGSGGRNRRNDAKAESAGAGGFRHPYKGKHIDISL